MQREGHFFLAPDNGVLSLIFENLAATELRMLDFLLESPMPLRDVFADAVGHLALGLDFEKIGSPVENFAQRIHFQPVTTPNLIRGAVMHIDFFENVVVNISRETFEKVANGRAFSLHFRRNDPITRLSKNYADAPVGEPLCHFNSAGLLRDRGQYRPGSNTFWAENGGSGAGGFSLKITGPDGFGLFLLKICSTVF